MGIDYAAKKAGIDLVRDVPKPGQRRAKDWATLIGMARKLEADERKEDSESHKKIEDLSMQVVELTRTNAELCKELAEFRLKERLTQIELPQRDARFLLTGEKVA